MKPKILDAIKSDAQKKVFAARLADVSKLMTELKQTGEIDAISVTLQNDAAMFFSKRKEVTDSDGRASLQQIINILKK